VTRADTNASASKPVDRESIRIVLVDDEPTTLEVLELLLRAEGFVDLHAIQDSTTAMDLIWKSRPQLVLLDLMMPEVDGLQILRGIRSTPGLEQTAVVVLSASTDAESRSKALEIGADAFLAKPVISSEFSRCVQETLERRSRGVLES